MTNETEAIKKDYSKLKDTVINFIVPIIAGLVCLALAAFVIYPTLKQMPVQKAEYKAKQDLNDQLTVKVQNLKKLLDFKKAVDEDATLVSAALVSEAMVPQLLTQIDQIAKENGLAVTKLSYSFSEAATPEKATTTEELNALLAAPYKMVNISLGAKGNYAQLTNFFNSLEGAARLVNVDNFRYTTGSDPAAVYLDFAIALSSPYLYVQSNAVTDDSVNMDVSAPAFRSFMDKIKSLKFYSPTQVDINEVLKKVSESSQSTGSANQ